MRWLAVQNVKFKLINVYFFRRFSLIPSAHLSIVHSKVEILDLVIKVFTWRHYI